MLAYFGCWWECWRVVDLVSWFGRASQGKLRSERRTRWVISLFFFLCVDVDFFSGRCWVRRLYCSSCDMHACSQHYIDFPRHGKKLYIFISLPRRAYTLFRVILFAHFPIYWIGSLLSPSIASISYLFVVSWKAYDILLYQTRKALAVVAAIAIAILSDTQLSLTDFWRYFSGYGVLFFYGLSSAALEHTLGVLSPALGTTFSTAATTLGATIFALPFYIFRSAVVCSISFRPLFELIGHRCIAGFSTNACPSTHISSIFPSDCILPSIPDAPYDILSW